MRRKNREDAPSTVRLPENPWRYFLKGSDTFLVPLRELVHGRRAHSGNAGRYMREAFDGTRDRRKAILVGPKRADGTRIVLDGNSTLAAARAANWRFLPVREADNPMEALAEYNLSLENAAMARRLLEGITEAGDLCGMSPPVCVGNLGIPRRDMPQLGDALAPFLRAQQRKGHRVRQTRRPVGLLRATQREIQAAKIVKFAQALERGERWVIDVPIVVSSDGYVLDGHHRWAAAVVVDPRLEMSVYEVDAPIETLLTDSLAFEGVTRADMSGAAVGAPKPNPRGGREKSERVMFWITRPPAGWKVRPDQRFALWMQRPGVTVLDGHEQFLGVFSSTTKAEERALRAAAPHTPIINRTLLGTYSHHAFKNPRGGAHRGRARSAWQVDRDARRTAHEDLYRQVDEAERDAERGWGGGYPLDVFGRPITRGRKDP